MAAIVKFGRIMPPPSTVLALPRMRGDRYQATKAAVRERCKHLHLTPAQTAECVDHAAALMRRGRSGAVATNAGIRMAKDIAAAREAWQPGGAA